MGKVLTKREVMSCAERVSEAAEALRLEAGLCSDDRLQALAYQVETIAAELRATELL